MKKRNKAGFVRSVSKGAAKGLGRLGKDTAKSVVGEIASILTLGLFRPKRKKHW